MFIIITPLCEFSPTAAIKTRASPDSTAPPPKQNGLDSLMVTATLSPVSCELLILRLWPVTYIPSAGTLSPFLMIIMSPTSTSMFKICCSNVRCPSFLN